MTKPLPTCCEYHGIDCSHGQGRACPERRELVLHRFWTEPVPDAETTISMFEYALAWIFLAALICVSAWVIVKAWPILSLLIA